MDVAATWARDAGPELDRTPLVEACRGLRSRPDMTMQTGRLLLAATRFDGSDEEIVGRLTEVCALAAEQPVAAALLADALVVRVAADRQAAPAAICAAAERLRRDGRLAAGLFAVSLTSYGRVLGWPDGWRTQLHALREHYLADVRMTALGLVTTDETDGIRPRTRRGRRPARR